MKAAYPYENAAWWQFEVDRSLKSENVGIGTNYIAICEIATEAGHAKTRTAALEIQAG